jgi:hypothetical protein
VLFTDRFVYVHQPKTGGTFVTSMLLQLHGVEWNRLFHLQSMVRRNIRRRTPLGTFVYNNNKHGTCAEIPSSERDKRILATVRNPFDWYVSQHEFGWWKRKDFLPYYRAVPGFDEDYAEFPDLAFEPWLRLMYAAFGGDGVGYASREFVRFYFREPDSVLPKIDAGYIESGRFRDDMFDVDFLHTERLNVELHDFLARVGYPSEQIEFVLEHERVLPRGRGRAGGAAAPSYYSAELEAEVRRRDALLFAALPEYAASPAPDPTSPAPSSRTP